MVDAVRTHSHECGPECQHNLVRWFVCIVSAHMRLRQENPKFQSSWDFRVRLLGDGAAKKNVPAQCWRTTGPDGVK